MAPAFHCGIVQLAASCSASRQKRTNARLAHRKVAARHHDLIGDICWRQLARSIDKSRPAVMVIPIAEGDATGLTLAARIARVRWKAGEVSCDARCPAR